MNDTAPPEIRLLPARPGRIRLAVADRGSGVDPGTLAPKVDGRIRLFTYRRNVLTIRGLRRGTHRVTLTAADYQETKNMENVGPILPNTRHFSARVHVP